MIRSKAPTVSRVISPSVSSLGAHWALQRLLSAKIPAKLRGILILRGGREVVKTSGLVLHSFNGAPDWIFQCVAICRSRRAPALAHQLLRAYAVEMHFEDLEENVLL